jgi:site-specific recombinase XerD
MTFDEAVELYLDDMRAEGRINSPHTIASYRSRLNALGDEVRNRSPHTVGIADLERTLRRWPHPATGQHARSVYVSFFDWAMHARIRKDNPARGTRPRKVKAPNVYRLTRSEVIALFEACETPREDRAIRIGCLAGLRNQELCGLQLRHFKRPGAIWVSPDIAKGGRQRFIPILAELEAVVASIHENVGEDDYVIAGRRPIGGSNATWREVPTLPSSPRQAGHCRGEHT